MDGQVVFIDARGQTILRPRCDWAGEFSEGLAPIRIGTKFGMIDKVGAIVIGAAFDRVYSFSEGLAHIEQEGKSGFMNRVGKIVIEPRFAKRPSRR